MKIWYTLPSPKRSQFQLSIYVQTLCMNSLVYFYHVEGDDNWSYFAVLVWISLVTKGWNFCSRMNCQLFAALRKCTSRLGAQDCRCQVGGSDLAMAWWPGSLRSLQGTSAGLNGLASGLTVVNELGHPAFLAHDLQNSPGKPKLAQPKLAHTVAARFQENEQNRAKPPDTRLGTVTTVCLPHSVSQSKSWGPVRFRGGKRDYAIMWETTDLLQRGVGTGKEKLELFSFQSTIYVFFRWIYNKETKTSI